MDADQGREVVEQSRQLDRLLRDTRRRLYAAAAASDHEVLGSILTLPDAQVEAMEQRLRRGLRSAELDHRRAVARLASNDAPLPFADAADQDNAPATAAGHTQYGANYRVGDDERTDLIRRSLSLTRLAEIGFTKGLPLGSSAPITAAAEDVLVVVCNHDAADLGGDVAHRLAARLPVPAVVVRAGAGTVNPGSEPRVRSGAELSDLRAANPEAAIILVVVNSPVVSHARNARRILESVTVSATWLCLDAREDVASLIRATHNLVGDLEVTAIAASHVWQARRPGNILETGLPIGLIDGAPASDELWELIARDALDRLTRRS